MKKEMGDVKKIILFGGTTEGRMLAERLSEAGLETLVCVATEYGEEVMPARAGIRIQRGRLTPEKMEEMFEREKPDLVVDATHPFAVVVSGNIQAASASYRLPYLRLKRPEGKREKGDCIRYFADTASCVEELERQEGRILLTTGSKELASYCHKPSLRERIYARVLPAMESLQICRDQGLEGRQIAAMQGPFGVEMNRAMIRQLQIEILVTKESGGAGGFEEKARAAEAEGIRLFVIGRPKEEEGQTFEEICEQLIPEQVQCNHSSGPEIQCNHSSGPEISLIGMGMGDGGSLTMDAHRALEEADYVFGASRLVEGIRGKAQVMPYYLAKDILPKLEKIAMEGRPRVCVLFSGDTGFYSGCGKLARALMEAGYSDIRVIPGISSMAYLAARAGCDWQKASIFSIHGRGGRETWGKQLTDLVRTSPQTFLLVSGREDMACVGKMLGEEGLSHVRLTVGYQLSYGEEEILEIGVEECAGLSKEGLYACFLWNAAPRGKILTPSLQDQAFLRDRVPMTKEEIRHISLCKLGLWEGAVFYDIGSGSGSIAVEAAKLSSRLKVYAIEKKEAALTLTRENIKRLGVPQVEVVEGEAPEALMDLPAPSHAFIGGSGGRLEEILETLVRKNPRLRVVVTAVSLETISELTGLMKTMPCRSRCLVLQASRTREAGAYHLLQAENPVLIATFEFGEEKEG